MVNKAAKALIIIACISTGIVAVLLAPLQIVQYEGTNTVQYSASVDQINLITNSDIANVEIRYATDPNADLINLSYHYLIRHAIIFSAPNVTVSFINSTLGTVLTVQVIVDFISLGFTSIASSATILTINPRLLSNLSIHVGTGNINLNNTNSLNKTFIDIDLRTATGNIGVDLAAYSHVTGDFYCSSASGNLAVVTGTRTIIDGSMQVYASSGNINVDLATATTLANYLYIRAISGNSGLELGENASIDGITQVNTTSGNVDLFLNDGAILLDDFLLKTSSGNVNFVFSNISLANNAVKGTLRTGSGNIMSYAQQLTDLNGNLTLDATTGSGNVNFYIYLEADYLSSTIVPATISGTTYYIPNNPSGFLPSHPPLTSTTPDRASNIDANLQTISGNIYIYASRT